MKVTNTGSGRRAAAGAAALAAAAVLSLAFAGCTGSSATSPSVPPGTPVSPPSSGNINETVTPSATPEAIKTDLTAPATPMNGLSARVSKVEAITAKAQGPGEVSGPAVAVTITLENTGSQPFDTSLLSVNLTDSKGLPGDGMIASPAAWIKQPVPAGGKVTGVYVFSVPKANRHPITISLSVNPGLPTVNFSGNV